MLRHPSHCVALGRLGLGLALGLVLAGCQAETDESKKAGPPSAELSPEPVELAPPTRPTRSGHLVIAADLWRSRCEDDCEAQARLCRMREHLENFTDILPGGSRMSKEGGPICDPYPCEEEEREELPGPDLCDTAEQICLDRCEADVADAPPAEPPPECTTEACIEGAHRVSVDVSLGDHSLTERSVLCPAGFMATGGGFSVVDDPNIFVWKNGPNADASGWRFGISNYGNVDRTGTLYAVCLGGP